MISALLDMMTTLTATDRSSDSPMTYVERFYRHLLASINADHPVSNAMIGATLC
jgi:hypothetical protein